MYKNLGYGNIVNCRFHLFFDDFPHVPGGIHPIHPPAPAQRLQQIHLRLLHGALPQLGHTPAVQRFAVPTVQLQGARGAVDGPRIPGKIG